MDAPIILEFHDIYPSPRLGINTYPLKKFHTLVKKIKQYYNISSDLKTSKNSVVFTFDDGYSSILEYALPVMNQHGISGIVIIVTGFCGKKNDWDPSPLSPPISHLNLDSIKLFLKNQWQIIPHGHRHIAYRKFNVPEVFFDFSHSLQWFKKHLSLHPEFFALPFNQIDKFTYTTLHKKFAFVPIFLGGISPNPFYIKRLPIYSFMSPDMILRMIEKWPKIDATWYYLLQNIQRGAQVSAYWQRYINKYSKKQ